jgi:hypothetical protein
MGASGKPAREPHGGTRQSMLNSVDGKVQRIQWMLYAEASNDKDKRFKQVYRFLNQAWWVERAIDAVLRNRGSRTAGMDGATRENYLTDEQRGRLNIIRSRFAGSTSRRPTENCVLWVFRPSRIV